MDAVPSSRRQVSDHRHSNIRRIFCRPNVVHCGVAIPQTSRPEIDRLGMITVQRCQASTRAGPEREPTNWAMSPLLAITGLPQQN
jgi:hypothetical protein